MRRLRRFWAVAVALLAVAFGSLLTSTAVSASLPTPGPPTAVHATGIIGVPGATVSWNSPVSDGGSPILYYVATNYTGSRSCSVSDPGPHTCHIDGLKVGTVKPNIRVRAVSANGRGAVVVTDITVTSNGTATDNPPTSPTSGVTLASVSPPSASTSSGSAAGKSATTTGSPTGAPAQLPFTGANVELLSAIGTLGVVLGALLMLQPRRRLRPHVSAADLLLQY